jgi:SsrA-binding protein
MKKSAQSKLITNRRATFDYYLDNEIIVGISLTGAETKAARMGHVQLKGSYATINNNELWLINASFSVRSNEKGNDKTIDNRTRKLLAHRKQIDNLIESKKQGLTIIPTKMLTNGRFIKLIIATGQGKKKYDKREVIKKRDIARENARMLK